MWRWISGSSCSCLLVGLIVLPSFPELSEDLAGAGCLLWDQFLLGLCSARRPLSRPVLPSSADPSGTRM